MRRKIRRRRKGMGKKIVPKREQKNLALGLKCSRAQQRHSRNMSFVLCDVVCSARELGHRRYRYTCVDVASHVCTVPFQSIDDVNNGGRF